jgi:hypothetical protein
MIREDRFLDRKLEVAMAKEKGLLDDFKLVHRRGRRASIDMNAT